MATTEERLTEVENAVALMEAQIASKAKRDTTSATLVALESEVDAMKTQVQTAFDRALTLANRNRVLSQTVDAL